MARILSSYPPSRYIGPVFPTTRFTYNKKCFVAEASDFRGQPVYGQLYEDACDVGMLIENPATGQAVPFVLSHDERDRDGDLVAQHFTVSTESVRKNPRLAGLRVTILND